MISPKIVECVCKEHEGSRRSGRTLPSEITPQSPDRVTAVLER